MNILVVCDYKIYSERIGGMDRFFKLFDEKAKERGHKITWIFSDVLPFDFYNNMEVVSAKNQGLLTFTDKYLTNCNDNIDVLITHFITQFALIFKRFKTKYHIPKIISVDHNPRPLNGFTFKKRIKKRISGILYHKFIDKIIGVSQYTSNHSVKDFGKHTAKKTQTIYNGIDISIFKNKKVLDPQNKIINFIIVSHLRESKGIQDLLKALTKLTGIEKTKLTISIFGSGPYEATLKKMCSDYNLNKIVSFKGSSPEIHLNLYRFDYMLQPTYMECFSLSILESLLSNVPVITTRVGGNAEVVVDKINGWLFDAKDVNTLTSILKNIISGKYKIENNIYTTIEENYSLELMVANHLKLL
ncbi:MAG: glycosyltransferase family 4 protein [Flavobacteriaceae bacterium]